MLKTRVPKSVLFSSHFSQEGSNETGRWKQNIAGRYIINKNSICHFEGENFCSSAIKGATKVASKSRRAFKGPAVKVRLMWKIVSQWQTEGVFRINWRCCHQNSTWACCQLPWSGCWVAIRAIFSAPTRSQFAKFNLDAIWNTPQAAAAQFYLHCCAPAHPHSVAFERGEYISFFFFCQFPRLGWAGRRVAYAKGEVGPTYHPSVKGCTA